MDTAQTLQLHPLPKSRILGAITPDRRWLLTMIDVIVGYTAAEYRLERNGWYVEAALVETRADFRGGETVVLRCFPVSAQGNRALPVSALQFTAQRIINAVDGVARIVIDSPSSAPCMELDSAADNIRDDQSYTDSKRSAG